VGMEKVDNEGVLGHGYNPKKPRRTEKANMGNGEGSYKESFIKIEGEYEVNGLGLGLVRELGGRKM